MRDKHGRDCTLQPAMWQRYADRLAKNKLLSHLFQHQSCCHQTVLAGVFMAGRICPPCPTLFAQSRTATASDSPYSPSGNSVEAVRKIVNTLGMPSIQPGQ